MEKTFTLMKHIKRIISQGGYYLCWNPEKELHWMGRHGGVCLIQIQ